MNYQIIPLDVGHFAALPRDACLCRMYRGQTYEAPCIMWYIKGTKNNILVDLAPPDPEQTLKNHGLVINRSAQQEPVNALKSIGLSPEDIKLIIITHLHYDHAWGFHHFKNARFLIQRKEISYAIAPPPIMRKGYYETSLGKPQFVDYLDKIDVLDGDTEIEDGVSAIFIPSHSPGFQGISVRTDKGKYFIAGDALGVFEAFEQKPYIPSGVFTSLEEYYESIKKIEKIADFILPGHDMKVLEKSVYP